MTQFLPPNLLALFAARDPIPYLPPPCKLPHEKKQKGYDGLANFLDNFEQAHETPPPTRVETRGERLERRRRERAEQTAYKLEQEIAVWKPADDVDATLDPFKTLFIARINYDTSQSKLRREFEGYGPIKKIRMIFNTVDGKPRGYAFIEYEHERDMHSAYKHADGKKIDGKRVLVDVERARTVKGWLPRRLGGGLGGTRRGGADVNVKHSGREDNERERERYRLERERDERAGHRPDRDREERRRRSRSRSVRRRSRSPRAAGPGARPRPERADRDREREREPRDRTREPKEEDADKKDRRRKRSRSRSERRRERRERDKERGDRDKERDRDRDRDRDRKRSRRDKDKDKDKERERERKEPKVKTEDIKIKEEPIDDYPDTSAGDADAAGLELNIKQEQDDEKYDVHANGDHYY